MSAATCLWFSPTDAPEAVELYRRLVPGFREVAHRVLDAAEGQPGTGAEVWELEMAGQPFQVMGAGHNQPFGTAMSISLRVEDQRQLDAVWDGFLAAGGREVACGWITDPFGVNWQVVPQVFFDVVSSGTQEQAQRVAEACWQMVRIDVAAMEDAARG